MAVSSKSPPPLSPVPEISSRPTRVRWAMDDLLTRDGHRLSLSFASSVAVVNEPAERKLLAEVFGNPMSLTTAAVGSHFLPGLRAAATDLAGRDSAEALLSPAAKSRWLDALKAAANEVGFSCGLAVLAPFELEIFSPTMQRERLESMQRIAAERRSADRVGHFARAAELLKQWESLKASVPSVTPGKLLEQVNPADRGLMLDTLLMASAANQSGANTPDLWAVSGQTLVRVDVKGESPQAKLIALPTAAGPLRSISASGGKLLAGARAGVMIVDEANADASQVYLHPELVSEHGFTSVTMLGNRIWGCHRVGGLVGWQIGQMARPEVVFTPAQFGGEPKLFNSAGLFAVGTRLCRLTAGLKIETVLGAGQPIMAILPGDGRIIVASETGLVLLLDGSTLEKLSEISTTGRLSGAALLPWLSSSRLLLNRADGAIDCIGLEDQLLTQFSSGQVGMRAVTACAGKVAAMSSDRQRILLWNPWDGRKTAGEIYVTGMTHHRVADLVLSEPQPSRKI